MSAYNGVYDDAGTQELYPEVHTTEVVGHMGYGVLSRELRPTQHVRMDNCSRPPNTTVSGPNEIGEVREHIDVTTMLLLHSRLLCINSILLRFGGSESPHDIEG